MADHSLDQIFDGDAKASPAPVMERQEPEQKGEPTAAPPAAQSQPNAEPAEGPTVPRKALEDERGKRQTLERQLAEMQRQLTAPKPAAQPPADWFADPEGAAKQLYHQMEEMRLNDRANLSERAAVRAYGKELVAEAREAAMQAGIARQLYERSPDPYDDLIQWYRKQKFIAEIGDDPEAYKQRLRDELRAEMSQGSNQQAAQSAKPPVPKSLASVPSAQPRDSGGRFAPSAPSLSQLLD